MTPPAALPALTPELQAVAYQVLTASLPADQVLVMCRILAAAIAAAGAPPAIELEAIAEETELTHADVAWHLADLIADGWIARDTAGHWRPAIAPHVHAGRPGTRPAPEHA